MVGNSFLVTFHQMPGTLMLILGSAFNKLGNSLIWYFHSFPKSGILGLLSKALCQVYENNIIMAFLSLENEINIIAALYNNFFW